MLTNIKKRVIQHKINKLLSQYGVTVAHHTPGRIRIKIAGWQKNEKLFNQLLNEVELDPAIEEVHFTPETGSILIYYIKDSHSDQETQRRWLEMGNKYFAEQVGSL